LADAEPPEEARHAALDTPPMLTLAPGRASVILEYSAKRQPMTKLLELALDRLSRQSAAEQDRIARMILEDLEAEAQWQDRFRRSQDKLSALAESARREIARGDIVDRDPADGPSE
jgi:hypothetical protein